MMDILIRQASYYGTFENVLFFVSMAVMLYLAWLSTGFETLDYRLWVTQIFTCSSHRLLQLHDMNGPEEHIFNSVPRGYDWHRHVTTLILVRRPTTADRGIRTWNFFSRTQHSPEDAVINQLFSEFITEQINNCPTRNEDQSVRLISENRPVRYMSNSSRQMRGMTRTRILVRRRHGILNSSNYLTHVHIVRLPIVTHAMLETDENDVTVAEETDSDDSSSDSEEEVETESSNQEATPLSPKPKVENKHHASINDIIVELRLINKDPKTVATTLMSTVAQFRQHGEVDETTRLYFEGVLLEYNDKTLHDYGFYDKCVVQGEAGPSEQVMNIRLKHLDDTILNIIVPNNATVGDVKRTHYAEKLAANRVIRFIYQGQLLRNDSKTLSSYGVIDQAVIHVHIGQAAYRQEGVNGTETPPQAGRDITDRVGIHVITGFQWLDNALYVLLSYVLWLGHWAEADDVLEEDTSILARIHRFLRSTIRTMVGIITDLLVPDNQEADPELIHNFGNYFHFFLFVKLMLILVVGIVYQDIAELKTLILLSLILGFTLMYVYAVSNQRRLVRR